MFEWFKRKRRIAKLCKEYAREKGFLREYQIARAHGYSPIEALEDWDLLTDEIQMKIQAERNQVIDIEITPPHGEECTVITIDSVALTIRIRERPAAPAAPRKTSNAFQNFIIDSKRAEDVLLHLHTFIDGKSTKNCALTILAAIEAGLLTQPTFSALRSEFPEIGVRPNYAYYLSRAANYSLEITAIAKNF